MTNEDYRLRLLVAKKKRYQSLRDAIWNGDSRTSQFNQASLLECHLLLNEIIYLEGKVGISDDCDLTFIDAPK
jgi:hypothetical protein